jgi:hypothetical protein
VIKANIKTYFKENNTPPLFRPERQVQATKKAFPKKGLNPHNSPGAKRPAP